MNTLLIAFSMADLSAHWLQILLGGAALYALFGPDPRPVIKAIVNRKAGATAVLSSTDAPSVGTLAEYLKAIADHCETVEDKEALAACDRIAPTLFHEHKPAVIQ